MLRFVAVVLAVSALTLGLAAAAAPDKVPIEKPAPLLRSKSPLDAAWAKQLTPKVEPVPPPEPKPLEAPPDFAAIKRMTLEQKAFVLQAQPEQVAGPIKLSARKLYHDDRNFIELVSRYGGINVSPVKDRVVFVGSADLMSYNWDRPRAYLHIRQQPGRRYLVECAVASSGTDAATISASSGGLTYSVNTIDKVTLMFPIEPVAAAKDLLFDLSGDRAWILGGCEVSWTGP